MEARTLALPLVVFLAAVLAGCSGLSTGENLPVSPRHCEQGSIPDQELRASLRQAAAGETQELLLALRSTNGTLQLALLSPQGLPLYRIVCNQSGPQVSVQSGSELVVSPLEMLGYLELALATPASLAVALRPGWSLEELDGDRRFRKAGENLEISIDYGTKEGKPGHVQVEDVDKGIRLVLRVLGGSRVVSE
ncbi:MAG: DUF3261 domain-containing protein, partial [Halieaceae bacterium]|nr:DUF3261 domain-containing protein [Halieaceae bacterium]MCB1855974.1 DUF3261 domain-containing protein [Halieaceae bacterium]